MARVAGLVLIVLAIAVASVVCLVKTSSQVAAVFDTIKADLGLGTVNGSSDLSALQTYLDLEKEFLKDEEVVAKAGQDLAAASAKSYHTLEVDFEKAEKAVVAVGNEIADVFRKLHITDGCECVKDTCGCCSHIEDVTIHLNATACVNVTYLSQDYGISITATLNKYTIYNETVSAKNPPPICVGAPYVKDFADLCLRLHDVEATRRSLRACASAEARFKHILVAKYEMGCFAIGKPGTAEQEDLDRRYMLAMIDEAQGNVTSTTLASKKLADKRGTAEEEELNRQYRLAMIDKTQHNGTTYTSATKTKAGKRGTAEEEELDRRYRLALMDKAQRKAATTTGAPKT